MTRTLRQSLTLAAAVVLLAAGTACSSSDESGGTSRPISLQSDSTPLVAF